MIASRSHLHAPFRTLAAGIAAVLGLAGQAQAQSLTPDQFDALMNTIKPELEFFGKTLN